MKHTTGAFLTSALLLVSVGACGGSGKTEHIDPGRVALATPPPPPDVAAGVCIDATPSIERAIPERARTLLVERLTSWVTPSVVSSEGSAPVPALELLVRRVTQDVVALGTAGEVGHVRIPAVPGVAPAPGPVSNLLELQAERRKQVVAADKARSLAMSKTAEAAEVLQGADLTSPESDIRGCVEALARAMPRGKILLVSDLEQYGVPQVGVASLRHIELTIVHACTTAGACVEQQTSWQAMLSEAGARPPVFLAVENMAMAFDAIFSPTTR